MSGGSADATARDVPDRLEQLGRRRGLVDDAVRAGHAREHLDRVARGARVDDHPQLGALRLEPPAQRDPVAVAELVVEQHDVRAVAGEQVGRVGGARCRADGDEARLGAQQQREPGAHRGLWIDDRDARHGGNRPRRG